MVNGYPPDQSRHLRASLHRENLGELPNGPCGWKPPKEGQLLAMIYGWGRWYPVEHVLIVAARTEPALSRPSPLRSRSEEQIS